MNRNQRPVYRFYCTTRPRWLQWPN